MKPLVIYHNSCADGFAAAFAAWLKIGDEAEYVPCQYGQDFFAESFLLQFNDREVYVLDFSFPHNVMDVLFQNAKRVVWLDHHKTAFEMWLGRFNKGDRFQDSFEPKYFLLLDDNKSGAHLAWEYFHPGTEVPTFIRHIDDYDRWQFKIEGTKAFNKALWSYAPWSFEQWQRMMLYTLRQTYDGYKHFVREGQAILRAHEQNVQSVVKNATRKCEIPFDEEAALDCVEPRLEWNNGGYWMVQGLAANCPPHLQSDVGHELANQSGTFGLLWHIDKGNVCRCSLRSNGDYDVSAIAKVFGGGGHRNAAGFTTDIQTLLDWIK